jgi:hypothetical protein
MKIGGEIDKENEIVLDNVIDLANSFTLHKDGVTIDISLEGISYTSYTEQREGFLFGSYFGNYVFRDYGKLKNFAIRAMYDMLITDITIHKSYLPRLRNSPVIPKRTIEENMDRVYALDFFYFGGYVTIVSLLRGPGEFANIIVTYNDMVTLASMLDEQQVIGLYAKIPLKGLGRGYRFDFLLLVDDNTKVLLDKLIFIYRHISGYLKEEGITLKDVLEDIDLYTYVAAAAAT